MDVQFDVNVHLSNPIILENGVSPTTPPAVSTALSQRDMPSMDRKGFARCDCKLVLPELETWSVFLQLWKTSSAGFDSIITTCKFMYLLSIHIYLIYYILYNKIYHNILYTYILHTYQWIEPLLSNHPVGIPLASRMLFGLAEQLAQKAFPDLAQWRRSLRELPNFYSGHPPTCSI